VQTATTGLDGTYSLRVPEGHQYVFVREEPHSDPVPAVSPPGFSFPSVTYRDLDLSEGQTATVDWAFPGSPVAPIIARVLDPKGRPVPGAEVIAIPRGLFLPWHGYTVRTDARGECRLAPQDLALRARSGTMGTPGLTHVKHGGRLDLRLRPNVLGTVSGVVLDDKGKPWAGIPVSATAYIPGPAEGQYVGFYYHEPWGPSRLAATVTTGADGRFVIPDLWPTEKYTLRLPHDSEPRPAIELKPGEHRDLGPVRRVKSRSAVP